MSKVGESLSNCLPYVWEEIAKETLTIVWMSNLSGESWRSHFGSTFLLDAMVA